MARVAFMTAGVLLAEWGDPLVQGFVDRTTQNFKTAALSPGFVALHDGDVPGSDWGGELVIPQTLERPEFVGKRVFTLSLWEDLESVFAFAYNASHAESLRHRNEWFVKGDMPGYVAWWVADDHFPDWGEAAARLDQLYQNGSSPGGFDFKRPYTAQGQPAQIDRQQVAAKAAALAVIPQPSPDGPPSIAHDGSSPAPFSHQPESISLSPDSIAALLSVYLAAWNEPDLAARLALLEEAWDEHGVYTDPDSHAVGRQALAAVIGDLYAKYPGAYFTLQGKIDSHHTFCRFFWTLHLKNGAQLPGMDYGEISPAGKLARIVGFF